jgi:hypothetical protein
VAPRVFVPVSAGKATALISSGTCFGQDRTSSPVSVSVVMEGRPTRR